MPAALNSLKVGAVKVLNGKITDKFSTFVNPEVPIPYKIEELTSINDNMVLDAPTIEEILPKFLEFSEGCVMVAHNASFDMGFIEANCKRQGIEKEFTFDVADMDFVTKEVVCPNCANHCEVICVYRDEELIDSWGNRCERGEVKA